MDNLSHPINITELATINEYIGCYEKTMTFELVCKDYGYDCDFVATGEDGEYVMREFGKHTDDEHGLWYSEESLKQLFQNKYNKK